MTKAITYVFIFAVAVGLRLYWLEQKQGLHRNETQGIRIAQCQGQWQDIPDTLVGRQLSGRELKETTMLGHRAVRECLVQLRLAPNDPPHAAPYYMLQRMVNWRPTTSIGQMKQRLGALNMLLFALTFFVTMLLLRELFGPRPLLVGAGLIAMTWCTASIDVAIFFRDYALAALATATLSLAFVRLMRQINAHQCTLTTRRIIGFGLLVSLMLLARYEALVYVGLVYMALFVQALRTGQKHLLRPLCLTAVAALVSTLVIYANYFWFYVSGVGGSTLNRATGAEALTDLLRSVRGTLWLTCSHLFYVPTCIVLALLALIWCRPKRLGMASLLLAMGAVWTFLCVHFGQYKCIKYAMTSMPLLGLAVPMLLSHVRSKIWQGAAFVAITACYVWGALVAYPDPLREAEIESCRLGANLPQREFNYIPQPRVDYIYPDAPATFPKGRDIVMLTGDGQTAYSDIMPSIPDSVNITLMPKTDFTRRVARQLPEGTLVFVPVHIGDGCTVPAAVHELTQEPIYRRCIFVYRK